MTRTTSAFVVLLIILFPGLVQNSKADANSTDSNGLYYVSSWAIGEAKGSDGSTVNLGAKADIQIHHAHVYSVNNANTDFEMQLDTSEYPVDPKTGAILKPVALRVGDRVFPSSGGGGTTGSYNSLFFNNIHGSEEAKAAAKWLSVGCALRNAPGYKFLTQFIPAQSEFTANQPVLVKLKLKNLDDRTIAFQRGGQQRGARDNQYGFRAMLNEQPVADTGSPINFGGLCGIVSLEPGKEFEDQVDLRKWFNFGRAGTYFIHGFYRLDFFLPGNKNEGLAPWNVLWQDYASADFQVVIK